MKHISLLLSVIFLTGCSATMSELLTEAKECISTSINPQGIIGKPTDEQSTACWKKVNNKVEVNAKREHEREIEKANACPKGTTKWCRVYSRNDKRCSCVSRYEIGRILRGYY